MTSPAHYERRAKELDHADPIASLRDHFLLEGDVTSYLDGNSLGRPTREAANSLNHFVKNTWGKGLIRSWERGWFDEPLVLGDRIGELTLGAANGQVFVGDSTTVTLYKLIHAALDVNSGRNEIIVDAADFPTDRFLLEGIARDRGKVLRWVHPAPDQGVLREEVQRLLSGSTALVVLSYGAYRSGYLSDIVGITADTHDAGGMVLWDLCHSVGVVPLELDAWGVDLAAGCTYKYLNGGPGSPSFGYVAQRHVSNLQQPIQGWMGAADVFAMGPEFVPSSGIRRFISGTPPIMGTIAIHGMLDLIEQAGTTAIRGKSVALTEFAVELIDDLLVPLGARLASPRDPKLRGSHVTVDHDRFESILPGLWAQGIIPDFRGPDGLRLGLSPLSTSFDEVRRGVGGIHQALVSEQ